MATPALDQLLGKYPAPVRDLALAARKLVIERLPAAQEIVDPSDGVVGYGYGAGYNDLICTLILSKSGVKLGIVRGAELPDPDRLLEGSGKVHRYVQLDAPSDLREPGLMRLLEAAMAAWKERAGPSSRSRRPRK
jgi:hypothetical protein